MTRGSILGTVCAKAQEGKGTGAFKKLRDVQRREPRQETRDISKVCSPMDFGHIRLL